MVRLIVRSTRRLAVFAAGLVMMVAGLVMLVTPGPGMLVIVAGLALLATEFTWAEILLERTKRHAAKATKATISAVNGRRRRAPSVPPSVELETEPAE